MQRALLAACVTQAVALTMPFATPATWKVHTLGGPRVAKVDGAYTLFYHYRPLEDKDDPELPPLSTGRIGRATSPDGLEWEVQHDGLGEGGSSVSKAEDWFQHDCGHVGCGDVLSGDAWFLYTYGGSNAPMALRDLGVDRDGEVYGMDMKLGVCVSQDGIKFGRFEGDEADGSLLGPPPANSWERRNAPVAWPAVCEDPGGQTGDLLLFYGTTQDATGLSACGLARSSNGVTWRRATPASPCIQAGDDWDAGGILRRSVLRRGRELLMIYEAKSAEGVHAFGRATSDDAGVTWTKTGRCFERGDTWDAHAISAPHLLEEDGRLRLYYAGSGEAGGSASLGVAESSDDGVTWTRL